MKMRSSATYGFGRIHSRGNMSWHSLDGKEYLGNPSISTLVARYMLALKRRKVLSSQILIRNYASYSLIIIQHARGELSMSSRAITAAHILQMYNYRNQPERLVPVPIQQISRDTPKSLDNWGGPRLRLLVHVIVVLAFSCLLRCDEVVNLRAEDVEVLGPDCISFCLTSRKTSPFGGM